MSVETVEIVEFDASKLATLQLGVDRGMLFADAVTICRNMVNEPGNRMTPSRMAERALKAADDAGLAIEVLDTADLEALGMGAFLGVAQGSVEPPKLIVMKYEGDSDDTPTTTWPSSARGSRSTAEGYPSSRRRTWAT